jgi:ABC-type multidrug transport system ATPase subunit
MIDFGSIKKTYHGQNVLDIDNFSVEENKIYIVTGSNGSGKSTLAKILSGLIEDDSGKLKKVYKKDGSEYKIGYLTQKPYVFDLSLESNILICGNDKNKCNELIEKFGIGYLRGKNAKSFSGGETQKMGLARFMMKDYDIVIFDESTSAMDEESKNKVAKILKNYAFNKTMIMITHDLPHVQGIADKIIEMNGGKINDRPIKS